MDVALSRCDCVVTVSILNIQVPQDGSHLVICVDPPAAYLFPYRWQLRSHGLSGPTEHSSEGPEKRSFQPLGETQIKPPTYVLQKGVGVPWIYRRHDFILLDICKSGLGEVLSSPVLIRYRFPGSVCRVHKISEPLDVQAVWRDTAVIAARFEVYLQ